MKSFTVQFHQEDQTDTMTVQKLSEDDFNQCDRRWNETFI